MQDVAHAKEACQQWAHARVGLLPLIEVIPVLFDFDKAMFTLGEVVWGNDQGGYARECAEVANEEATA